MPKAAFLLLLASALMLARTGAAAAAGASGLSAGQKVPEAAGVVIQGEPGIRLSALRGRVVVLDFWASWCGPCVQSMPKLNALWHEVRAAGYGDRFEVLAVGLDRQVSKARRFLELHPVDYPVVVDTVGIASSSYGVWRLPATYLIDPTGRATQIYFGDGPDFASDLRRRVFALLSPQAAATAAQASEDTGNP